METWSRFCHLFPRKMDPFAGANEYPQFLLLTFLPDFQDGSRKLKSTTTWDEAFRDSSRQKSEGPQQLFEDFLRNLYFPCMLW